MTNFFDRCLAAYTGPIIGDNVIVRPWDRTEAEPVSDFLNMDDKAYLRYKDWPTDDYEWSPQFVREHVFGVFENDKVEGHFRPAVYTKDEQKIIGTMLLWEDNLGRTRLSPYMSPSVRRTGLGKDAYRATLDWALESNLATSFYSEVKPDNTASAALMDSVGFIEAGPVRSRTSSTEGWIMRAFHKSPHLSFTPA